MIKVIKWEKKEDGNYVSPDGFVIIKLSGNKWVMIDSIDEVEEVEEVEDILDQALNAGAKQRLISELGQFHFFTEVFEKKGELVFEHQFTSVAPELF